MDLLDLVAALTHPSKLLILARNWRSHYLGSLMQRFDALAEFLGDDHEVVIGSKFLDRFLAEKFLLHPETAHALFRSQLGSVGQIEAISRTLVDFLRVANLKHDFKDTICVGESICYPVYLHGIPTDLVGTTGFVPRAGYYSTLSAPKEPEHTYCKIEAVLNRLKLNSEDAYQFAIENITLLCIRDDLENPTSFSSSSYGRYAGLTLIANLEAHHIDDYRIIDSLYHEAIHAVIYFYEELYPPLVCEESERRGVLISPWSGNGLNAVQFVQACFVWLGLHSLWTAFNKNSGTPLRGTQEWLQRRAYAGFLKNPAEILLQSSEVQLVRDEALNAVIAIQEIFRSGSVEVLRR